MCDKRICHFCCVGRKSTCMYVPEYVCMCSLEGEREENGPIRVLLMKRISCRNTNRKWEVEEGKRI